jgi:phage gp36-like protein
MPTLEFTFRVDEALADATSVVLSDPTGTFGVRRMDTSAVVVADGTAMTNASTGVYRHTFTAPAAGLTYEWVAEVVYEGVTYHFEREFTDSDAGGEAAGDWLTEAYLDTRYGDENVTIQAGKDGDPTDEEIAAAIQRAIDDAEDEVKLLLIRRYASPLAVDDLTDADVATLSRLTAPFAMYHLYAGRGDVPSDAENRYRAERDDARAQLEGLVGGDDPFLSLPDKSGFGGGAVESLTGLSPAGGGLTDATDCCVPDIRRTICT